MLKLSRDVGPYFGVSLEPRTTFVTIRVKDTELCMTTNMKVSKWAQGIGEC